MTELMVVIVIVVVLATIGFSAARQARFKARSLECLTQVRSWGSVITAANMDLGGGRLYCPDQFASIGPGESPFTLYWAETVGLDGDSDRNVGHPSSHYDYDDEYKGLIAPMQAEMRSCPCHIAGVNQFGNPASSYTMNTYLQKAGASSNGHKILRLREIPRPSKKIYMIDCEANGNQSMRSQGQSTLVNGVELVSKFHGKNVNALFLDMHIEPMTSHQLDNDWDSFTQADK